jgi:NAD(P)-dependent dehydrogenase (short-subunit alcohol dehydrogenase family)
MPNTGSRPRTVIITGGASGIGLATTERLLAVGWRVAAFDRDQAAIAKLHNAYGDKVRADVLDVTDEPAAEAAVNNVAAVRRAVLHHTPMRRYAVPDEVATATLFLLDGTQSSFITGAILPVDGGFTGAGLMELEEGLPEED